MTITEKILAAAAGKSKVEAGDLIDAKIDCIMCHDVTTPAAISMLKEKNGGHHHKKFMITSQDSK